MSKVDYQNKVLPRFVLAHQAQRLSIRSPYLMCLLYVLINV